MLSRHAYQPTKSFLSTKEASNIPFTKPFAQATSPGNQGRGYAGQAGYCDRSLAVKMGSGN
jgi:hypothetical protein